MNDVSDVMTSIYDTLLQLRYPHITNTESKDLESTILSGENRICLLSWLLTEKSPSIVAHLGKLKNSALEDQVFEHYAQIGICNNKDVLLGKCSLKEQLPTLKLLLDFMRKVYVKPIESTNETEAALTDILKLCISETDQTSSLSAIKSKISYAEATKYFEEIEKQILNNDCEEVKTNMSQDLHIETDDRVVNEEQTVLFDNEKKRFIEAFHTVSSWPVTARDLDKDISDSICSNIKSICSDFSSLKKILQAKEELSNVKLAEELPKTITPLNAIIEDIVICNEELTNLISNGLE
ncbi:PREDICTED: uncharacterized protein LOC108780814 [Cyphomyrmex costatus]|uniref:Uncharacterized protein n=1 Tax=Cyphomyrmex costatus TaxID=456900 RepID=A0A195D530_9HYME|nr:PREDICTED: uncharacterized protein LOC108780814 [Cyphomyrmex costatus]KYN07534.1 hypothetical protein ALC62_01736 [Cyphomyrmex costatus]